MAISAPQIDYARKDTDKVQVNTELTPGVIFHNETIVISINAFHSRYYYRVELLLLFPLAVLMSNLLFSHQSMKSIAQ